MLNEGAIRGYDGYMPESYNHDGHGYGHGTGDIYWNGHGSGYACGWCDDSGISSTTMQNQDSSLGVSHEQGLGLGTGDPYGNGWG